MYKETLHAITGIGIFPVISLLLFIAVFSLAVIRAFRMRHADADRLASLPLDEAPLLAHESDGIREFDNALPRWWLYGFYFTIAFAAVYMTNYHILPTPIVGRRGMVAEYQAEMAAAPKPRAHAVDAVALNVLTDPESLAQGRAIFEGKENVCASCHRPDLGGLIGPNLTDDKWRHGCSVGAIVSSIKTGYPLQGMMPFGTGKTLNDEQVLKVTSYILSRSGSSPPEPKPIDPQLDTACR